LDFGSPYFIQLGLSNLGFLIGCLKGAFLTWWKKWNGGGI